MALYVVTLLDTKAPDIEIRAIEKLLLSGPNSEISVDAAETLMATRPTSEADQAAVLRVIHDNALPFQLRGQLLLATASPRVGRLIVDNIIQVANTSDNKQMRDVAIAAAIQVGSRALSGIRNRLNQILNDPTEAPESHRIAQRALNPGIHVE